jgi:hypothetical protein
VVAVFVDGVLVIAAMDQVSADVSVLVVLGIGIGIGIGTASGPQAENYWWKGVIPTVRYSSALACWAVL